jgi:glycosyltransferase involved in cell wall biosynthesis
LIDIVVPVYNEQAVLERSVRRLHAFLSAELPFTWRIVIADNASTDSTPAIARSLAQELDRTTVLRLSAKGRGRALRAAWSASEADILAYMDVDLSTDLRALLPLVAGLISGHSEVAIGTRLAPGSRVARGGRREFISRSYNLLLRTTLRARFSDAQCGFKAIRADAARRLLPLVKDQGWFFDTELLIQAQRHGLRIQEVAVDWVDDPDSRVDIVATAMTDLRGVARLRLDSPLARFLVIGLGSIPRRPGRGGGAGGGQRRGHPHPLLRPAHLGVRPGAHRRPAPRLPLTRRRASSNGVVAVKNHRRWG